MIPFEKSITNDGLINDTNERVKKGFFQIDWFHQCSSINHIELFYFRVHFQENSILISRKDIILFQLLPIDPQSSQYQ